MNAANHPLLFSLLVVLVFAACCVMVLVFFVLFEMIDWFAKNRWPGSP